MSIKAVIFDMDGTLIDSELHWVTAETEFLNKYNIRLTPEHAQKVTGRSLHESVALLKEEFGLTATVEELLTEKNRASETIYTYKAKALPGATELIMAVKKFGKKSAIASGSSIDRITMIVDRMGWQGKFDEIISSDHVNYIGKPDPAIYRYTLDLLELKPEECVVIEDSVNGVLSAKGAGIPCVAVVNEKWSRGDFSLADAIVPTLTDPRLYGLLGLI
jgi:HAD superfamily hydrolase (TIGR01509 family)